MRAMLSLVQMSFNCVVMSQYRQGSERLTWKDLTSIELQTRLGSLVSRSTRGLVAMSGDFASS